MNLNIIRRNEPLKSRKTPLKKSEIAIDLKSNIKGVKSMQQYICTIFNIFTAHFIAFSWASII